MNLISLVIPLGIIVFFIVEQCVERALHKKIQDSGETTPQEIDETAPVVSYLELQQESQKNIETTQME